MSEQTENPWLPHIALIGIVAVCVVTHTLVIAPFLLMGAALALRNRMLLFAGFTLILFFVVMLVFAGVIGGSVEGGIE